MNELLRYTAYRSFLIRLVEFHGLGKNNQYRLPACVVLAGRVNYPSLNGVDVGFKDNTFTTITTPLQQF